MKGATTEEEVQLDEVGEGKDSRVRQRFAVRLAWLACCPVVEAEFGCSTQLLCPPSKDPGTEGRVQSSDVLAVSGASLLLY